MTSPHAKGITAKKVEEQSPKTKRDDYFAI